MLCRTAQKLFDAYGDGLLQQIDKELFETHLDHCEKCTKALQQHYYTLDALTTFKEPSLKAQKWESIHDGYMDRLDSEVFTYHKKTFNSSAFWFQNTANFLYRINLNGWTTGGLLVSLLILIALFKFDFNPINQDRELLLPWVAHLQGNGVITRNGQSTNETIKNLLQVRPGDMIACDSASELLLQLDPGTAFLLKNGAIVRVDIYNDSLQRFSLQKGSLLARVAKRANGHRQEIVTPDAFCTIIGTQFELSYLNGKSGTTKLSVVEGCVSYSHNSLTIGNKSIYVKSGQQINSQSVAASVDLSQSQVDLLKRELSRIPMALDTTKHNQHFAPITINSEPSGAAVKINSQPMGTTPVMRAVDAESIYVSVELDGFTTWSRLFKIRDDTTAVKIIAHLEPEPLPQPSLKKTAEKQLSIGTVLKNIAVNQSLDLDTHLDQALSLLSSGKQAEAITSFKSIFANHRYSASHRSRAFNQALAQVRSNGDCENASKLTLCYLESSPEPMLAEAAQFELAQMKFNNCNLDQPAISALNEYIKKYPKGMFLAEAYNSLAEVNSYYGRFKEAGQTYETLLTMSLQKSQRINILYRLAHIYDRRMKKPQLALDTYSRIINENSRSAVAEEALFWKADCLYRQKRYADARIAFSDYVKHYPSGAWFTESMQRLSSMNVSYDK